jgi:pimeloyl-ACP methyl ester carboxylesterase
MRFWTILRPSHRITARATSVTKAGHLRLFPNQTPPPPCFKLVRKSQLIDEYFPVDDDSERLIVAHSFGGMVACEWAWRRREYLKKTKLFVIASPIRIRVPSPGHVVSYVQPDGRTIRQLILGPTYPPDVIGEGLASGAACFGENDSLAPQSISGFPDWPHLTNYRPISAMHWTIVRHLKTKQNLQEFARVL